MAACMEINCGNIRDGSQQYLEKIVFLSKEARTMHNVTVGAPRISKLGRNEDLTEAGKSEIPFLLNTSHLG